jgi:hypothetical protein
MWKSSHRIRIVCILILLSISSCGLFKKNCHCPSFGQSITPFDVLTFPNNEKSYLKAPLKPSDLKQNKPISTQNKPA